jgi:hypothetical protein
MICKVSHATRLNSDQQVERIHLAWLYCAATNAVNSVTHGAGSCAPTYFSPRTTNSTDNLKIEVGKWVIW